jgi:hypothetical protein
VATASTLALAQRRGSQPRQASGTKVTGDATCAADLGAGSASGREFCDVIIAPAGAGSIGMTIPRHTGAATLFVDLHNRFTVLPDVHDPSQAFVRHTAIIAVVRPNGQVIDRAAVQHEYRTVADVFDRIVGAGPGGFKTVAPGKPDAVRITIPAGVSSIGIVGQRLEIMTRTTLASFDTPGRPIAIASNWRIEYRPR